MASLFWKGCLSMQDDAVVVLENKPVDDTTASGCDCSLDSADRSKGTKASLLETLASQGQWDAVISLVSDSQRDDWISNATENNYEIANEAVTETCNEIANETTIRMATPLHLALQHRPPLHVVEALLLKLQEKLDVHVIEEIQDGDGKTPLHLAVTAGCDHDVVQRLLEGETLCMPAVVQDDQGRTPLHWACATPAIKRKKPHIFAADPMIKENWNKERVIRKLTDEFPEAAAVVDHHGQTPGEYAAQYKMTQLTVVTLKRAAEAHAPKSQKGITEDEDEPHLPWESLLAQQPEVPIVVPSRERSTCLLPLNQESIEQLDRVWQETCELEGCDSEVSTIGDQEALMLEEFFEDP